MSQTTSSVVAYKVTGQWQDYYITKTVAIGVLNVSGSLCHGCRNNESVTYCELLKTEVEEFSEIFPSWTYFVSNIFVLSDPPFYCLLEEYHRMWCRQKDIRLVNFFQRVYKTLPWKILVNIHSFFEHVTNNHCCWSEYEIDLCKMIRMRMLHLKMRAVLHVVTFFSYMMRTIYVPGKTLVKKLAIDFYSYSNP